MWKETPVASTDATTLAGETPTAFGLSLLTDGNAADGRETLELDSVISGSTGATDNRVLRSDGTGGGTAQSSAVAIDDSGNITGAGTIDVGNADTTLSRASAGNVAVEGNLIYRAGGTDVPVTDGGTGASTAAGARANLGALGSPYTAPPAVATLNAVHAVTSAYDLTAGGFMLYNDGTSNNQILAYDVTATQLTVAIRRRDKILNNNDMCGISMRDSSTGKYITFFLYSNFATAAFEMVTAKWNSYNSFNNNYVVTAGLTGLSGAVYAGNIIWMRIRVSGGSWYAEWGYDNVTWIQHDTQTVADFMTIDRIGVAINCGASDPMWLECDSWVAA